MLFDHDSGSDADADVDGEKPGLGLSATQLLQLRIWTWVSRGLGLASLMQPVLTLHWLKGSPHRHFAEAPGFIQPWFPRLASLPLFLLGADLVLFVMRPTQIPRLLLSIAIYVAAGIAWFLLIMMTLQFH